MHFHANYASTSVFGDGDYYETTFEDEQDTDDPDSTYLLIQRQFEHPNDHQCYIETHDKKYSVQSSSIVRGTILSARPLRWWLRSSPKHSQLVKIISGEIEPPDARAA